MYEIRDFKMVLAIHENGSLARAARILGVGQPVLTRQLAALEARICGQLFERTSRGAIATDLGRTIASQASVILELIEGLNRHAGESRGKAVRDLNIAAGAYMAETLCLTAAARMIATHAQVRVRLISANWTEVPHLVHGREAALGLLDVRSLRNDPALELELLHPHPGVFVARPGHPLAGRATVDLADILAFPMVFIGRAPTAVHTPMAEARAKARNTGALHAAFPALIQESPTVGLASLPHCDLVAAVTAAIAEREVEAGRVIVLPWRAPWLSVHPGIVWLRNRPLNEAEQFMLDLLRDADRETHRSSKAFCDRIGLSADCG